MKNIVFLLLLTLTFTFSACGGGGGGNSSTDNVNPDGSVTKTLSVKNSTTLDMKGENGEELSLSIPSLPLGSEDTEVNFKISYTDSLPKLVIDTDIEFVSGLTFTLKSSVFKDGDFALVYVADDGTEYDIAYTQDGDTITATLTHFSTYQIVPAPSNTASESDIKSHLSSWESNNASKTMEDVGMVNINSLHAKIQNLPDSENKTAFLKRFKDALLVLAGNSLSEWKSLHIDYFNKYCMTQEFKDTIIHFQQLYTLFENFGSSNDEAFDMLQTEIILLVNAHFESSYQAWSAISLPACNAIDTPAYVNCAVDYDSFITDVLILYFDGLARFNNQDEIMKTLESNVVAGANAAMSSPDGCDCVTIYKTIILEHFHSSQVGLINDIDLYLTTHCQNACPLLWNISYSHSYTSEESGDPALDVANATFKNVLIYPRGDYYDNDMSLQEEEACSAYMDDNGRATQTSAVTYSHTIDGYTDPQEGAPSFYYSCISGSDCVFRDSKTDTPFNQLEAGYLSGSSLEEQWQKYGYPTVKYYTDSIEVDIFEEIYKRDAFNINDSKAQMSFTPVEIR